MNKRQNCVRTCLSCRKKCDKSELIRVVKTPKGEIFYDKEGKLDGRGAYICNNPSCFLQLHKRRGLNRSFKTKVSDEVYANIKNALSSNRIDFIGLPLKAGKLSIGFTKVLESIKKNEAKLVLITEDISEKTKKEIYYYANKHNIKVRQIPYDCDELYKIIKKSVVVLSINDINFAKMVDKKL